MPDQCTQDDGINPSPVQQGIHLSVANVKRKFVNIGSLTAKWMKIKSEKHCKSDEDLARLLIRSLQKHDHQSHYGRHIFRKRKGKPVLGSQKIIMLQNDVWMHWRELKCSLQVNSNSQLAVVLMNAWHDRATYIQKLYDATKASQQNPTDMVKQNETYKNKNFVEDKPVNNAPAPMNEASAHMNKPPAPMNNAPVNAAPPGMVMHPAHRNMTPSGLNVTPGLLNMNLSHLSMTPSYINLSHAPMNVTPAGMNVTPAPVNVTPHINVTFDPMNVTPVNMNVTPACMDMTSTPMNMTPASLNVTPAPLNVTPASMNMIPAPMNMIPAFMNVTPASMNLTPAHMNDAPAIMSMIKVKEEIMPDQSGNINRYSVPDNEAPSDFQYRRVKIECVSEESGADSGSDSDIDDIMNYVQTEKKMIKITEDPAENCSEIGNRRKSSRVQSRGYRPDYANLDWLEDNEKNNNGDVRNNQDSNSLSQPYMRKLFNSTTEEMMTAYGKILDGFEKKRNNKKKLKEDPDFVLSDQESVKDPDECDDSRDQIKKVKSSTKEEQDDSSSDSNTSNKEKKKCKGKVGRPRGKYKKRKKEDDEWFQIEKKPKEKQPKVEKKPWVHIKLEEHQDKYNIEVVGSFARKNRNVDLSEEVYSCLVCGLFKSTARDIFEAHIEKHVNKALECDQCEFVGRSEVALMKHRNAAGHIYISGRRDFFMCDICGHVLYTRDARRTHMGKEHNKPLFFCRYCPEKFYTRAKCQLHQRTVHSDIVKYCFNCETDLSSITLEEFKEHQSSCQIAHQCQVCGIILSKKSILAYHIKSIHMNVRKYQCSTCQYAAKSAQRLREHEMTHKSVHPYSCDQCTFTCVQKYQLTSHMRTHSGEKPYKCSQCKFAAAWNVQLKEHIKVHSMENTVVCLQCDIVFRNEKSLKMHEKKDH